MTLYHGSENIIEAPEFGKGARNNDYGKGFYCTENIELAREWACAKNKSGYVNVYEFDLTGLKVLNLNDGQYHILNWLAILADNRTYWQRGSIAEEAKEYIKTHFLLDVSPYDVIIGCLLYTSTVHRKIKRNGIPRVVGNLFLFYVQIETKVKVGSACGSLKVFRHMLV